MRPRSSQSVVSASPTPSTRVIGVQAHPLAVGRAQQVDGQLGVDEQVLAPVERGADAVADVGGDHEALQRRRLLALDERAAHAHPDRRRAGLEEAAVHEAVLHRRVVADLLAGGKEVAVAPWSGPGGRRLGLEADVADGHAPGVGAHHLAVRAGQRSPRAARRCGPGARPRASTVSGASGTGPRISTVMRPIRMPVARLAALERAGEQRRRRPGVLGAGIPRPAGELAGHERSPSRV